MNEENKYSTEMQHSKINEKRRKGIILLENWLRELEDTLSVEDHQANVEYKVKDDRKFTLWDTLPDTLTALHISEYLQISRRRVYELFLLHVDEGGIPNFSIGASKRVEKKDFKMWISRKKSETF